MAVRSAGSCSPRVIGSQYSPGGAGTFGPPRRVSVGRPEAVTQPPSAGHGRGRTRRDLRPSQAVGAAPAGVPPVAAVRSPGRPSRPVPSARLVQHRFPGRGPLLAGWAPGMGSVAAPDADPELSRLLLRIAGDLSAAWRARGQRGRPGGRADSCRCASCWGSPACCGPPPAGCTASGPRCWRRDCSPPSPGRNSWAPWPPLTRWRCSCWPWPLAGRAIRRRPVRDADRSSRHRWRHPGQPPTPSSTRPSCSRRSCSRSWPWPSGASTRGRAWLAALLAMLGPWLTLVVAAVVAGGDGYWLGITSQHPDPAAIGCSRETVLQQCVRVDEPDSGPRRSGRRAGQPDGGSRETSAGRAGRRRPAGPGRAGQFCTRPSACKSTWCSAPGSPRSPRATRWRA